jgi:hypothetical protein
MQATRRATKPDCIPWIEIETRAWMFGAVRNERDWFVEAFLRELRARPDLFQVALRSETAPGRKVEMFGSGPSNNEALPAVRAHHFEAPPSLFPPSWAPSTSGEWEVLFSAMDVLYGSWDGLHGYLSDRRNLEGWLNFRFKTFPVTYFVILDTAHSGTRRCWRGTSHGLRYARGDTVLAGTRYASMQRHRTSCSSSVHRSG